MNSAVSLADMQGRKMLLQAADGEQHLLLRDGLRSAQLLCLGVDITVEPAAMNLLLDEIPRVEPKLRLAKRAMDIYRATGQSGDGRHWSTQTLWHRNALVALDGWLAGASQRQIAALIYGQERIDREWRAPDQTIKNRVARAIRRGRELMEGGYRNLLK
ncbi:MAG: DUF2285 domain-containing protein [Kiloniellales bacterium]